MRIQYIFLAGSARRAIECVPPWFSKWESGLKFGEKNLRMVHVFLMGRRTTFLTTKTRRHEGRDTGGSFSSCLRAFVVKFFLVLFLCAATLALTGCFGERSFPMVPERLAKMATVSEGEKLSARGWTVEANAAAEHLLPASEVAPLTTDNFLDNGHALDVYHYFHINRATSTISSPTCMGLNKPLR